MDLTEQLWLLKQIYDDRSYYDSEKNMHLYHIPKKISDEDLEKLRQANHLPNQMVFPLHDDTIKELSRLAGTWTLAEAAEAFIAGLWSAPFLWQSALSAKLISLVMPYHPHTPYAGSPNTCTVCGFKNHAVDTTLSWFINMTGGTPLDGEPVGHVFALQEMDRFMTRPQPTEYDIWTLRAILTVIRSLPPKTRYSKLRDILHREKLLPTSKKWVYGSLLETLALIGVLDTDEYPGMATKYTTYQKRDERPSVQVEVQAPLAWWNSDIGVNESVLKMVFPDIDCSSVSLTDRPTAIPPLDETTTGKLERRKPLRKTVPRSPDAGKGPVQAQDVYAIRVRDDVWITVYCYGVDGIYAIVEYLDGIFPEMPMTSQIKNTVRPRRDGRHQIKVSGIDRTTGVKRVARNIPAPLTSLPAPDRIPFSKASDLKYLATWCFDSLD